MAAFSDSEVIDQVKHVGDLAFEHSTACDLAGSGFQELSKHIRGLHWELLVLEKELVDPKSFLKRCDRHTEVELRELVEECEDDLQEIGGFLDSLSPQRRNSATPKDQDLQGFCKKICDRSSSFKDFRDQATFAGLGKMKEQLFLLVEDIVSGRRHPYILKKIVDWDALADELDQLVYADATALELDEDAESSEDEIVELPDSPAAGSKSPSPERPHTEEPKPSRKVRYRQPTVEDWVEGDDDELLSPATLPTPPHSSDTTVGSHTPDATSELSRSSEGNSRDAEDPMNDPNRKPRRVDTEMRIMQEEKLTIKEEIRRLKEAAEKLEEQNSLQEFHNFCIGISKANEGSLLAEPWHIPPQNFDKIAYFVMPSGAIHKSQDLKSNIKIPATPALQSAIHRGSSYASHASGGGSGGSTGGSAGIGSPFRRDSAIFNQPHKEGSFDFFSGLLPRKPDSGDAGQGIPDGRNDRWARIAESPREMSPVSNERTPTPSQPPPPSSQKKSPPLTPRPSDVIQKLPVTLEEAFHGTNRTVRIERQVFDKWTGTWRMEPKEIHIPIKKGIKAGSKLKCRGAGNQDADGVAQDIWFVIEDKRHFLFDRVGSDLHTTLDLTYREAVSGWRKEIWTIDGKKKKISGPKNTPDSWERVLPGHGMPRSRNPFERGDLIVNVKIQALKHSGPI